MVDEPDILRVFRNAFEERALQIVEILDEPALSALPVRFGHLRSFDYSVLGQMTFTGIETADGKPVVFVLTTLKSDAAYVDRELPKAVTAYDKAL